MRLYSAQTDATQIIKACLQHAATSVAHLEQALACLEEALQVQLLTKSHLDLLLKQGVDGTDPRLRKVIAEALLQRRIKEMVEMEGEVFWDTSFILCAEYQLFLDEQDQQRNAYQPDHWKERQFPTGEAFFLS